MTRRHILIGRRIQGAPQLFARIDWADGGGWLDTSVKLQGGASVVQTSLAALVEDALAELDGADVTITPRLVHDVIARGNPATLDLPLEAACDLLCPLGRENAPHEAGVWTRILLQPSAGMTRLLPNRFVEKRLAEEIKTILTREDLRERGQAHDSREFWVRRGLTAATILPDQVPPYIQPITDLGAEQDRQDRRDAKAKSARVKSASQKSVAAGAADRAAAAEYAARQERARAAAASKK